MPQFGEVRVDFITFTTGVSPDEANVTVPVSGLLRNPTFSGNVIISGDLDVYGDITNSGNYNTVTGNITTTGGTISGAAGQFTTLTGGTAGFTTVTGATVTGTTANFITVSGTTVTGDAAAFTSITGDTAGFTTVTGTTVTGTIANFATVSGTTITGDTAGFTTVTGATVTGTTANFVTVSGTTVTGDTGNFTTATITSGVFASGTAAAPSVSVGTTDNGLYSPGTDEVALATNGTGRLFIDSSGNVGIGDADPSSRGLFVTRFADNRYFAVNAASKIISRYDDNNAIENANFTNLGCTAANHGVLLRFNIGDGGVADSQGFIGYLRESDNNGYMRFSTNNSERVRIDSSGRLGVGTSSPRGLLHVGPDLASGATDAARINLKQNGLAATDGIYLERSGERRGYHMFIGGPNDGLTFRANNFGTVTTTMYLNREGKVGIGTTSPGYPLSIKAATSGGAAVFDLDNQIASNYGGLRVHLGKTDRECRLEATYNSSFFTFYTAASSGIGTERVRIDSSGRLLVGTSSARANFFNSTNTSLLQLEGTSSVDNTAISVILNEANDTSGTGIILARSRGSSNGSSTLVGNNAPLGAIYFQGADGTEFVEGARIQAFADGTTGANDMPTRLVFSTTADGASSPTERMRISQQGAIGALGVFNVTTANAANVNVDSNGLLQRSTSSAKYKTSIETLEDSYSDALLNCRPVWYRSTCEGDNPEHGWWGFIAEEVAEIDPRLVHWKTTEVTYDEKGSAVETPCDPEPEGVAYDRFVPHLLNLIKRQKEQIEAMEARLTAAGI